MEGNIRTGILGGDMSLRVAQIKNDETYLWLLNKHYAKRIPQIMFSFGLYRDDELIGVVTYGIPPSNSLCIGICGEEYAKDVLELNRLCLLNNGKNEASFLVSNSIKLLPKPKIVVSYADTSVNHVGYVYQATNFLYTGLTTKRGEWCVKGMEGKHSKALSYGMTLEKMKIKYGDDFYHRERDRKHRYIYFHGSKTQKKNYMKKLKYEIHHYPKGDTSSYDSGGVVETQRLLFV